jgi:hypothetical protein
MHFSSTAHPAVRYALVCWLQAAALMHLLIGLGLIWAGHSPLLGNYQLSNWRVTSRGGIRRLSCSDCPTDKTKPNHAV